MSCLSRISERLPPPRAMARAPPALRLIWLRLGALACRIGAARGALACRVGAGRGALACRVAARRRGALARFLGSLLPCWAGCPVSAPLLRPAGFLGLGARPFS